MAILLDHHHYPSFSFSELSFLLFAQCVRLKVLEGHNPQGRLVRGFQAHGWRHAVLKGLFPPGRAQAPKVARPKAWEAVLGCRRRQVIAAGSREREKLLRHLRADDVPSHVVVARGAAPVSEEAGHWPAGSRALLEHAPEDVHPPDGAHRESDSEDASRHQRPQKEMPRRVSPRKPRGCRAPRCC